MNHVPPVTLAHFTREWIADRRVVILRDGHALRAGEGLAIEIKSLRTNEWRRIALPGGAVAFTTAEDRDAVLKQLQEGAP